jgi:hypothetical protein
MICAQFALGGDVPNARLWLLTTETCRRAEAA